MQHIKEPKGIDFVVEPHKLTERDQQIMSKIIGDYKATGKITRAQSARKRRVTSKKVKRA
jgi:hypothetical protein